MSRLHRIAPLLAAGSLTLSAGADVLFDNGDPNGAGGTSNATSGVFGFRRTLLDDFAVPDGETWRIDTFRHRHVWNTPNGGTEGTGTEITIWRDLDGEPWHRDFDLIMTGYAEELVDFQDLVDLLVLWGPCEPPAECPGDFDGSGAVDFGDVLILISNWQPCGTA